ncbi:MULTISPECIES: cation:proton antiporter [Actinomyces]|uniref:Cation:proton antiporter n=1 Tax=Actinomyces respiraculi TaxID=2744574 RepID=A0A7T0PWB3_9ACTO|nr:MULTISPECIES: cation:proton antiporter [Actinomyces]QPL05544.1 cation:proton antiporter [Actinomyces respiraculi]
MGQSFVSLFLILVVAFLAPMVSRVIPRRMVPDTVLLILGGILIGPDLLGMATITSDVEFLRELGVAFLFLMAGYEIDVNELRGSGGRHAMIAWVGSLTLAFAAVSVIGVTGGPLSANGVAIAIAMTSTAIGTILPILRERGLMPTAVGTSILNHGAVGEVGPVILMALLLGSRSTWQSAAVLVFFLAVTLLIIRFTDRVKRLGQRLVTVIRLGGSTTAQTTVRLTVVLLVGLCALAEVFDLDVVLGAFAAGFILRYAVPDGDAELEDKLDGLAYGFFVPIFFVCSGMGVQVVLDRDTLFLIGAFLVLLVLVRGLPVWVAASVERRTDGERVFSLRQSTQVAVYSTTALPIIVAVTQVAVDSGAMSAAFASTLILAGVVSVLVMPALGLLLQSKADTVPAVEALGVVQGPSTQVEADMEERGLTRAEAQHLAQRLAELEEERRLWRTQMRAHLSHRTH